MRKISKIVVAALCTALLHAPLAWAAPPADAIPSDLAPTVLVQNLMSWLEGPLTGVLARPAPDEGALDHFAARAGVTIDPDGQPGSQRGVTIDPNGEPSEQIDITIDPNG